MVTPKRNARAKKNAGCMLLNRANWKKLVLIVRFLVPLKSSVFIFHMHQVDDELRKISRKDPKLMTARQRAMLERKSDKDAFGEQLLALPSGASSQPVLLGHEHHFDD